MKANNNNYPEILTEKESRRFWDKVNQDGPIIKPELGKCWEWTAYKAKNGYGKFTLRGTKALAHRLSYVVSNGQVDETLKIDHLCRNRLCVNPTHLEIVTNKENIARGNRPSTLGSHERIKTHCPRRHILKAPNLRKSRNGHRKCLACNRAQGYLKSHDGDMQEISDIYYSKMDI